MSTLYQLKDDKRQWSAGSGWQRVLSYEGPTGQLSAFLLSEASPGYTGYDQRDGEDSFTRIDLSYALPVADPPQGGGTAVGDGLISRQWSRDVVDVQRRLEELDKVAALAAFERTWPARIRISVQVYKAQLEEYLRDNTKTAPVETLPVPTKTPSSTLLGYANKYMDNLLLMDDPTFEDDEVVLTKTEIVTAASTLLASSTNTKRFHTYAALVRSEPTLPAAALINAAGLSDLYWFKKSPRVSQTTGGLFQIEQHYVGAVAYDEFRYKTLIR